MSSTASDKVWVFLEVRDGGLASVSLELLGKARSLAQEVGGGVAGVLLGADVSALAPVAFAAGADRVYLADDPRLAEYASLPYARVIGNLVAASTPDILLLGASALGRDLAPRLSALLGTGLTADCTDLHIAAAPREPSAAAREPSTVARDGATGAPAGPLLHQIRPAFGGNIIATIVTPRHRPQMATVRPGVFPPPVQEVGRRGEVISVPVELRGEDLVVEVLSREREECLVDLAGARVVVAGGAGVGSPEAFALVREFAEVLGGVVGATRAAVDAGWIPREHQIGQTGVTVRPKLYIAAGVSGSVQHCAGMSDSARILAINTDPDAPIFSLAHYGIVGDLKEVIPKLIKAYRATGGDGGS